MGVFYPTGKLMSALLNGINDRSSVIQKSFAFAIGHLVRVWKHTWIHTVFQMNPKATTEIQTNTLFSPSDIQRRQCWEASAETEHLVSGKRGYEDFDCKVIEKASSAVINTLMPIQNQLTWLTSSEHKRKKLSLLLMTKGNSQHGLSSFKQELLRAASKHGREKVIWIWNDMKMVSSMPHLY